MRCGVGAPYSGPVIARSSIAPVVVRAQAPRGQPAGRRLAQGQFPDLRVTTGRGRIQRRNEENSIRTALMDEKMAAPRRSHVANNAGVNPT